MLNPSELKKIDAYWRASNYLAAGQLYLLDNPMLRRPLTRDDVKKKIVGHSTSNKTSSTSILLINNKTPAPNNAIVADSIPSA